MSSAPAQRAHWDNVKIVLFLLLAGDAFFIGIHLVHVSSNTLLQNAMYSIQTDGGFSEWFQYLKEGWIAILCFALWKRTRSLFLVGWAFLFGYLLLDDSMQFHESGGESVSRHLHLTGMFGLRAQDLGELVVSGVMGLIFLFTIGLTYLRAPLNDKNVSRDFAFLVAVLVAFGVGVDSFHSIVASSTSYKTATITLGVIEDGGEMISMSIICWYAFDLFTRHGVVAEPRAWRRLKTHSPPDARYTRTTSRRRLSRDSTASHAARNSSDHPSDAA